MKKLFLFALVCSLLAVSILPAAAAAPGDLTLLADYVAENVQIFVSFRTDTEFIETLDGLINRLAKKIPDAESTMQTLTQTLNQAAQAVEPNSNFRRVFRPWLGETGAVFLTDAQSGDEPIIALSVADTRLAEAFLDKLTTSSVNRTTTYIKSRRRDSLTYTPSNRFGSTYRLMDAVLFIYNDNSSGLITRNQASLAESRRFQDALARLPGNDYSLLAYLDVLPTFSALAPMMNQQMERSGLHLFDFTALFRSMGPQMFGLTMAEGRALTLDIAQSITNIAAYERALGMPYVERAPLNPDFARFIPADAALVAHDQNLGQQVLMALALLEKIGERLDEHYDTPDIDKDEIGFLLLDDTMTFLRLTYQGLSGQTLEDAIGWMTGNYAMYVTLGAAGDLPTFDAGLIIANTDADASAAFFAGQKLLLHALNIYYAEDENTLLIPGIRQIAENFLPESMSDLPLLDNLELVMGMNEDVLTFGTRPATEAVLAGEGGLDADENFAAAAEYFLPEMQSLFYINFPPLTDLAIYGVENGSDDLQPLAEALSLFESGSITTLTTPERRGLSAVTRLVLTLAE